MFWTSGDLGKDFRGGNKKICTHFGGRGEGNFNLGGVFGFWNLSWKN